MLKNMNKHGGMENDDDDDFSSIMFAQANIQALIFLFTKYVQKCICNGKREAMPSLIKGKKTNVFFKFCS